LSALHRPTKPTQEQCELSTVNTTHTHTGTEEKSNEYDEYQQPFITYTKKRKYKCIK